MGGAGSARRVAAVMAVATSLSLGLASPVSAAFAEETDAPDSDMVQAAGAGKDLVRPESPAEPPATPAPTNESVGTSPIADQEPQLDGETTDPVPTLDPTPEATDPVDPEPTDPVNPDPTDNPPATTPEVPEGTTGPTGKEPSNVGESPVPQEPGNPFEPHDPVVVPEAGANEGTSAPEAETEWDAHWEGSNPTTPADSFATKPVKTDVPGEGGPQLGVKPTPEPTTELSHSGAEGIGVGALGASVLLALGGLLLHRQRRRDA